jgi:hypothetical protein
MGRVTRRSHLSDSCLSNLPVRNSLGASARPGRGSCLRRLRASDCLGGSEQTDRLASGGRTNLGARTARDRFHCIPADPWQWQGHRSTRLHESGDPASTVGTSLPEACRHCNVPRQWRTGWTLHTIAGAGSVARGRSGLCLDFAFAGRPPCLFAVIGSAAVLAATTHGPISAVVLTMELTGRDRSFILPLLLAVGTATVVARTIDRRSIYDARFSDKEVKKLQQARAPSAS